LDAKLTFKDERDGEEMRESVMESDDEKPRARSGRKKIKIEYIQEKSRRHITFSKRRFGIMKKVCLQRERLMTGL
jgi:hypothetical protein